MVQNAQGKIWNSVIDRIRRRLRRRKIVEFSLEYALSIDHQGRLVIDVFMRSERDMTQVTNVRALWRYGFSYTSDNIRYVVNNTSLSTLLAIRSMKPEITDDGRLLSELYPTVLNYLRTRTGVHEDSRSTAIEICDTPLTHRVDIDYNPVYGLTVKAGYEIPRQETVVSAHEFTRSPDDEYIKFGQVYYRIPEADSTIQKWMAAAEQTIALEATPDFFQHTLPHLKTLFHVVQRKQAQRIKILAHAFQPKITVTTARGWLHFRIDYTVDHYQLSHDLFSTAPAKHVHPDDYTWIKPDHTVIAAVNKQIEALAAEKTDHGYRTEITKFLPLEDAITTIGGTKSYSAEYQQFLKEITEFNYDPTFTLSPEFEKELQASGIHLRPYQRSGIHWLNWLTSHYLHGILADEMGLGKTIQTSIALKLLYETTGSRQHSLIICPKSVIGHWRRELNRIYPTQTVYAYIGLERDKFRFLRRKPILFLTTYATMSRDIALLEKIPFFCIVLDEGTRIKNPGTQRTLAAKKLHAVHRIVLSGTPIENRPRELWSLFDFLLKDHLGTYRQFLTNYGTPLQNNDQQAAENLAKRITPFILRRTKEAVAHDLPPKIEMSYYCGLTNEQKALYRQIRNRYVPPIQDALQKGESINYAANILPVITKLKQVCDHPALITGKNHPLLGRSEKFDLIVDTLNEILEKNEAAVLFSHFLGSLDLLEAYLQDRDVEYVRIDGTTKNRQQVIDQFNAGKAPIALCSLMAAGHGINLIAACHVIHMDRWWNPAVEDQATDRVHRIGQVNTVYVYKIVTEGTLEEKIETLLTKKRGLSDNIIGATTKGMAEWTTNEILEILQPL